MRSLNTAPTRRSRPSARAAKTAGTDGPRDRAARARDRQWAAAVERLRAERRGRSRIVTPCRAADRRLVKPPFRSFLNLWRAVGASPCRGELVTGISSRPGSRPLLHRGGVASVRLRVRHRRAEPFCYRPGPHALVGQPSRSRWTSSFNSFNTCARLIVDRVDRETGRRTCRGAHSPAPRRDPPVRQDGSRPDLCDRRQLHARDIASVGAKPWSSGAVARGSAR
jgi:hypothetical protein